MKQYSNEDTFSKFEIESTHNEIIRSKDENIDKNRNQSCTENTDETNIQYNN